MKSKIGIICLLLLCVYCLSAVCAADLNQTTDDIKTDNKDIKIVTVNEDLNDVNDDQAVDVNINSSESDSMDCVDKINKTSIDTIDDMKIQKNSVLINNTPSKLHNISLQKSPIKPIICSASGIKDPFGIKQIAEEISKLPTIVKMVPAYRDGIHYNITVTYKILKNNKTMVISYSHAPWFNSAINNATKEGDWNLVNKLTSLKKQLDKEKKYRDASIFLLPYYLGGVLF